MPPKRKRSPTTTIKPSKRNRKSNKVQYREQDIDGQSEQLATSEWPPSSSYSGTPNPHVDDTSQYSNLTSMSKSLLRSGRYKFASGETALDILDLTIDESTELPKPLTTACDTLESVIITVQKNTKAGNQEREGLIKMLKLHLDTIKNQLIKLAEDEETDKSSLPFDATIKEPLRTYASELRNIHDLVIKWNKNRQQTGGIIQTRSRELDTAFRQYTGELHRFVASTVDQARENLSQVDHAFLQKALSANPTRAQTINAYGVQHGQCRPGTRVQTLEAIRQWADSDDCSNWMFCLLDFAGSGKSTVSKHMDIEWKQNSKFMARFFFSRDTTETMSIDRFCPIVANAFASQDEEFNKAIEKFEKRRDYDLLSFEEQFEGLVVNPLKAFNRHAILIIDALDECDNKNDQRGKLLDMISNQLPSIPHLRVFVTGRPETDIKQWANTTTGVRCTNFLQLEGNQDDVGKYIKERLSHFPSSLQAQVSWVIENAEGVFIWARIACDLLCKTTDKQALLDSLGKQVTLDYLYTIALEQSVPKDDCSRSAARMVLGMVLTVQYPLSIAQLVHLSPKADAVEAVSTSLASILLYKDRNDPIRLIHATLREFLTSAIKSGPWFVQIGLGHYFLASGCIDLLVSVTREEQGQAFNSGDVGLKSAIDYSWVSWGGHCRDSSRKLGLNERVIDFIDAGYEYLLDDSIRQNSKGFTGGIFSICRVHLSPYTTHTLISRSLQWIRTRVLNADQLERLAEEKPNLLRDYRIDRDYRDIIRDHIDYIRDHIDDRDYRDYRDRIIRDYIHNTQRFLAEFERDLRKIAMELNIDLGDEDGNKDGDKGLVQVKELNVDLSDGDGDEDSKGD